MNLAIFCGGKSFEHDISILSTIQIYKGINKSYYSNIYVIYISRNNDLYLMKNIEISGFLSLSKDKPITLVKNGFNYKKKKFLIDCSLIIMHGNFGEDGRINALLDFYEIKYANSSIISSNYCLDKELMKEKFLLSKIPSLEFFVIKKEDEEIKNKFSYPVILKGSTLGSSIGIETCKKEEDFLNKVQSIFKFDTKIIVEPLLEDFEEYNIAIKMDLEKGMVLSNIEKVEKIGDILSFENKYQKATKKTINPEMSLELKNSIIEISKKVYLDFKLEYVTRFDFLVKNNVVYLNEVNNIPGSLSYYLFNESIDSHVHSLIKYALFKMNKKNEIGYNYINLNSVLNNNGKMK